jgi:DNA-binding CsgD family transcriptional regulator
LVDTVERSAPCSTHVPGRHGWFEKWRLILSPRARNHARHTGCSRERMLSSNTALPPRAHLRRSYAAPPVTHRLIVDASFCRSGREVAELAAPAICELFHATASLVLIFDACGQRTAEAFAGISHTHLISYLSFGTTKDPVLAAVLERQVAVHSGQLSTPDALESSPVCAGFAGNLRFFHYLAAPFYAGSGALLGVVTLGRAGYHDPFENADLRQLTALSGHLSANLARIPRDRPAVEAPVQLTKRERQVAILVMQGSNNLQIATALQIARETVKKTLQRLYDKLDVSGRAQMVKRVVDLGCL